MIKTMAMKVITMIKVDIFMIYIDIDISNTCFGILTYFWFLFWFLNYKVSQFGPINLLSLPLLVLSVSF